MKSQFAIDSLKDIVELQEVMSSSLEFLSTGEMQDIKATEKDDTYGSSYRVEIY